MAAPEGRGQAQGRATLRDVARLAGVSPQTVSNFINHRHRTRPATQRRVDAAIRQLGYRPNAAARALRSQRALSFGFVLEDPNDLGLDDPLHTAFLSGAAKAAHDLGYMVTVGISRPGEALDDARRLVREGRTDGLILSVGDAAAERDALRDLLDEGLPIVLLQQWITMPGVATVTAQDAAGASEVAALLARLGHRRVAFVAAEPDWPGPAQRRDGFLRSAREHGLAVDVWMAAAYTPAAARAVATRELSRADRATAALCANDLIALGVIQQATELGLRVPAELSVIGFNDFPFAAWLRPAISTVRIPSLEMGARAVELLASAVRERRIAESVAFPATIVERETTAQAPAPA